MSSAPPTAVDLEAIRAAAETIAPTVAPTPIVPSVTLSERYGGDVVVKAENLQETGPFKVRGATNKVRSLLASEPGLAGVTCASAGNHAQALALAARRAGMACDIFVPDGAPITKIEASEALGASVVEAGPTLRDAMLAANRRADEASYVFCHPFDDPAVVAGQGTIGTEIAGDVPELGMIVVPVGGGGLAAGTALAAKSLDPRVRVVGVQAAACAPYAGTEAPAGPITTLADGIAVKQPGAITQPLVERWVDEIVVVGEDAIADAMVVLMEQAKLYVEGAGAVGVAALLNGTVRPAREGTTCVVLSGGNVDLGVVPGLIRRHETDAGRRLVVFARIDDRPGGLARLLAVFAEAGANLIEVEHLREGVALHVRETEVHCTFEVRSSAHADAAVAAARAAGYQDLRVDSPDRA